MSNYGIRIINDKGYDIVANSANVFAIDSIINPTSSGQRSYTLVAGETITAVPIIQHPSAGNGYYLTGVTVSGNTVSWSVDTGVPTVRPTAIWVMKQGVV